MAITLLDIIGTITGKVAFERSQANFTALETEVNSHEELINDLDADKADKDQYVLLWSGNTSTLGNISLLSSCSGIYDAFIVHTGVGRAIMFYLFEQPDGNKKHLYDAPSQAILYYTASGIGELTAVDTTGLMLNLTSTGGQPLRSIYGIIRGFRK